MFVALLFNLITSVENLAFRSSTLLPYYSLRLNKVIRFIVVSDFFY